MERLLLVSNHASWGVVIVQTLFILALFRYFGLLLNRIPAQGLPLGKSEPRREVVDIEGEKHVLGEPSQRHQVLIFTSPNCPWCKELAPHFVPFTAALGPDYDLLLVVHDQPPAGEARSYAQRLGGGAPITLAVAPELFGALRGRLRSCAEKIDPADCLKAEASREAFVAWSCHDQRSEIRMPPGELQ